jgi:hypothetical protein
LTAARRGPVGFSTTFHKSTNDRRNTMTDYRSDVTEALLAANWTRTAREGELRNGGVFWRATTQPGDSAIRDGVEYFAEFGARGPVIVVVAACLAAAGQPAERLAEVIPLHPTV